MPTHLWPSCGRHFRVAEKRKKGKASINENPRWIHVRRALRRHTRRDKLGPSLWNEQWNLKVWSLSILSRTNYRAPFKSAFKFLRGIRRSEFVQIRSASRSGKLCSQSRLQTNDRSIASGSFIARAHALAFSDSGYINWRSQLSQAGQ